MLLAYITQCIMYFFCIFVFTMVNKMFFFTIYSENRFVSVIFTAGCGIVIKNNHKSCGIFFAIVTIAMVT